MYIVHLGSSYFPRGNAAVQRIRFTYRAISEAGYSPLVILKESNYTSSELRRVNHFDGIPYIFTSYQINRAGNKVTRKLNNYSGLLGELKLLFKKRKQIDTAILYNISSITELVYYTIVSKLLGFKLAFQYVEYRSAFEDSPFMLRTNDRLFDRYCSKFGDGVIVISEYLRNKIREHNPAKPMVKIPVLCDFKEFDKVQAAQPGYNYFLYCGTTEYLPVVSFVIELFERVKDKGLYKGKLMCIIGVNGAEAGRKLEALIAASKYSSDIVLHKSLPYAQIIPLYKAADLLLIPLRKTIQDIARFPHKIGEYTASQRPFISTAAGELNYYFKNGESAILANEYTVDAYFEALEKVLQQPGLLDTIGYKGYQTGMEHFHYQADVEPLKQFIQNLHTEKASKRLHLATAP
jgi:glycosyltransferase involved in cell wall biosynthesis